MSTAFGFGKTFANGWQVVFFPSLYRHLVPLHFLPFADAAGARAEATTRTRAARTRSRHPIGNLIEVRVAAGGGPVQSNRRVLRRR